MVRGFLRFVDVMEAILEAAHIQVVPEVVPTGLSTWLGERVVVLLEEHKSGSVSAHECVSDRHAKSIGNLLHLGMKYCQSCRDDHPSEI